MENFKPQSEIAKMKNPTRPLFATQTTVLSNANIIENKIPDMNNRLAKISQKGLMMGADGITRFSDGSVHSMPPQQ